MARDAWQRRALENTLLSQEIEARRYQLQQQAQQLEYERQLQEQELQRQQLEIQQQQLQLQNQQSLQQQENKILANRQENNLDVIYIGQGAGSSRKSSPRHDGMIVNGIIYSKSNSRVMIGEKGYVVNDTIAGGIITDISPGSVTIKFSDGTRSYATGDTITKVKHIMNDQEMAEFWKGYRERKRAAGIGE
jgi:multidrug efflux pump subunit AcrA (membrane-fusion protein)